ncbi:UDP-N-acetylmuramate dehydrogenase [Limibaculum sp. FT325]|uniref:UDP-N-acetylmuramate dehydrogenase n=1 Tax=Thermohalobaculum sediminis TaxID=2939436 RepID=UPI0020C13BE2|nr:UDP-N-acetylmuramate dehydrogenase [Limibaculum sediminis]MCL5777848.1 UDP-N-acetylmuramate dehydrogenase [Limibaculum sediminis]
MARPLDGERLLARLPPVRGRLTPMRPLAPLSWLRVGGPAEVFFQPADADDLADFLRGLPADVALMPLGLCSNLIIRDGGLPGVAIRLGADFAGIEVLDGARLRAGAAAPDSRVAIAAAQAGIAGLEFLRTIPGAIGGAVKMNAGCYGRYMADVVEEVAILDRHGREYRAGAAALGFGYRRSAVPDDHVILWAVLRGTPGGREASEALMEDYLARRAATQPVDQRSCGSTFRNPAGFSSTGAADDTHELKAWKLIDEAGCRGMRRGGAQMSEKHPNFLINAGEATAADLEELGEEVRARVKATSGHDLVWEIRRVGVRLAP